MAAGADPMELKRGIDRAVERIVGAIRAMAQPVSDNIVAQVGMNSANGNQAIGAIIAEAMESREGRRHRRGSQALDIVDGMQVDRGYLSRYFVTDPERMEAVLETRSS